MSAPDKKKMSLVMVIHAIMTLTLAGWFGYWGYQHHPAKEWMFKNEHSQKPFIPPKRTAQVKGKTALTGKPIQTPYAPKTLQSLMVGNRAGGFQSAITNFRLFWIDAGILFSGIALFYFGSGTYFRIIDNWMGAKTSGDVQAIRGRGLQDQALSENIGRGESH